MKRFDDEFDWHADQKRGALARMVDRLLEVLRRSFLDPFAYRERDDWPPQAPAWPPQTPDRRPCQLSNHRLVVSDWDRQFLCCGGVEVVFEMKKRPRDPSQLAKLMVDLASRQFKAEAAASA
jgi:hypothetical protein